MKRLRLLAASLPILSISFLGTIPVHAEGFHYGFGGFGKNKPTPEQMSAQQQNQFQEQASLLGISIDDVKNAWAEGKSIQQLMQEKNITQEQVNAHRKDLETQKLKSYLQNLVDKGVITQSQADKRLQTTQTKQAEQEKNKGGKNPRGMKGGFGSFHRGFWR